MTLFFSILASEILLFLGFLVFFHDKKSVTNRLFLIYSAVIAVWSVVNYFSLALTGPQVLFWIRLVLTLAVPHVFLFFLFVVNFPNSAIVISKKALSAILVWMFVLMVLTLTNNVFSGVHLVNGQAVPVPGKLIAYFVGSLVLVTLLTFYSLVKKYRIAKNQEKAQIAWIATGLIVTYLLLLIFVMLNVVVNKDTTFVPYSSLFILPLFLGITVAILRYQIFRVKVFATESLSFVLVVLSVWQILLAESIIQQILQIVMTILVVCFSILLIRSVLREVKQREQLEVLTKQLKQANDQLKVLDQARSEFLTIASHQLRTPPATIKWYLAAILDGDYGKFDDQVREQLRKTMSTNNSMIALIDDLLNVSRMERGKMEFIFQPTDLTEITQITIDQLLPQAEMKKLQVIFNKPTEALPVITADREKLRQVINNFIDNAIKYTMTGSITVELSKTTKDLKVKVTDTGKGVTADQAQHIFEKFDRGKSAARNSSGLGLGLYVAKFIVEQHKGKVWVESKGEGKGSSFIFTVPIKAKLDNTVFDLTKTQNA
jgi:signal transduction histidine kinase